MALGGATELFGVQPHIATFGRSMGNGLPVAAVAGEDEVMQNSAAGGVTQAGTYSGKRRRRRRSDGMIAELVTGELLETSNLAALLS